MEEAILTLIGCYLIIGFWLSADGVKQILPTIRTAGKVHWPALAFAFVVGMLWLPARFLRALFSHR
jgi:hypothetical protein